MFSTTNHHEANANPSRLMLAGLDSRRGPSSAFDLEDDDRLKLVPLPLFKELPAKHNPREKLKSLKRSHTVPSSAIMTRQDIATPHTPTQTMSTRMGSISPSPSSILSNYTFPPSRIRTLTATPTIIPSTPRSSRSPSLSFVPQVKKTKSPQHSKGQNSTSFNHPITSPRSSPPPDFLLDDDPFANLTGFGSGAKVNRQLSARANGGDVKTPSRSRLNNDEHNAGREETVAIGSGAIPAQKTSPSRAATRTSPSRITTAATPASPPKITTTPPSNNTTPISLTPTAFPGFGMRSSLPSIEPLTAPGWSISQPPLPKSPPPIPHSSHHHPSPSSPPPSHNVLPLPHRPSPAHQRPAFKSRPSLPSLNTLAKMNFVPGAGFGVRKVRKGKVGARLPFEPWNDLASGPNSSGETSPILMEEAEPETEMELETGGKILPPFPTLVSVMESAATSRHEDQDFPPSPPPKDSASSLPPPSSPPTLSPQLHAHIAADMSSPNILLPPTPSDSTLTLGPDPQPLVYEYCGGGRSEGGIVTELESSSRRSPQTVSAAPQVSLALVPPTQISSSSPPPQQMLRLPILESDNTPLSTDINVVSAPASSVGLDMTHGRDAKVSSPSNGLELPLPRSAFRHDDDDDVHVYAGGTGIVDDDSDNDVDQFMEQFMEHYDRVDREEDQRDDASTLGGLQDQEAEKHETLRKVDKRADKDENEMIMPIPTRPRSTSPLVAAATATSLVDMSHALSLSGSETISDSPTLPLFPDTSSAILAPTLRPRTRMRTTNAAITASVNLDNVTNNPPLVHDSYRYTYPHPSSPQNGEMEMELERLTSVSTPSAADSTPPASATWSPSGSASVSRSRSFSSTYTTLSFGSESESSYTRSSVGDDETHRYGNGIQQHSPPQQPSMLMKSPMDPMLQAEVSVLGSPPPLSMPFSGGNEDVGYIVSVPGPFPVHRGPLLSSNTDRDHDTAKTNDGSTATTYFSYHDDDDVHIEDRAGEAAGEGFDARNLWVEDEVLVQKRGEGIMRKEHNDPVMEVDEDEVGHGVEWEYIVGDKAVTGSDGKLDVVALDGHGRERVEHAIAIVTPDAIPPSDMKVATMQHSPSHIPTTTLTMPSMTLTTSHTALKDDLTSGSSTAAAVALAMSTWKQESSEPVQDSPSSTHGLRTQLSSAPSVSSTSSPSSRFPAVSRKGQSGFFESEDESEEEEEDESEEEDQEEEDKDDDIPLAKRIPSALTAQMSIRHQVRQEREKKKQEKALRGRAETTRTRLMTLRPTGSPSSSQPNQHLEPQQQPARSRHHTLTGKGSISVNPFSPEDLARKLRDINGLDDEENASNSAPVDAASWYQQQQRALNSRHRSKSMTRSLGDIYTSSPTEVLPPMPHFGSLTSHAQRTKSIKELSSSFRHYHTSPSPTPTVIAPPHHFPNRSLSQSRSSLERTSVTSPEFVPPVPTARIMHDDHHKSFRSHHYETSSSSRAMPIRISVDVDKPVRAISHRRRQVPVPVPAISSSTLSSPAHPSPVVASSKPELVVQQRVFISSMQRFNMVEIGVSTTAGDVIEMIKAEGSLKDFAGRSGGWMVFEVAQDFGMERPIRSFELVTDVQASWNKDKMVNYLVLRMTPLEVTLNRSAIPSSSPTHSGYVEWEAKRGKWSKRFMQLREHSIWLSKRDNGQDQVHLCSLSNFDAYQVTRTHRAPKPFAFALKSTDNLSFFENTADYLHSFACSEKDGKVWMEKILVARSYVLFQERHVLFNPKAPNGNASGLSRSGTRKATVPRPHVDVFEPGSLLSKQL